MAMSPRLLRPRDTAFTPRSISGLALWLDAADASSTYTTDAGPVTAVASPLDIAGCALWLDASDAGSITQSSGLVSQWSDKSGNDRHATASTTARPTTGTRTVGGRNALDFDGSANSMATGGSAFPTAATHTVFLVYQLDTASQSRTSALLTAATIAHQEIRVAGFGSTAVSYMFNNNLGTSMTSSVIGLGPVVFSAREASASMRSAGAGVVSATSGSAAAWSSGSMLIGSRTAGNFVDGLLCEIIIYPTTLTDSQTASVESYLATKWGISGVHVPATATSDPVGYWADKSGNNRHAVQATAGSRPTVGASSAAGKNAVRNNGTGAVALQVAAWPYTAGNTQFAVFNASALNQAIYQRGSLNDEPRMAVQGTSLGLYATRGGSSAAQTSSIIAYPAATWAIGATLFNTSLGQAYRDGVYGAATTDSQTFSGDQELRLLSLPSNIYGINGGIAEFLYYDRQLTATEVTRVARYLSSRWGITLAPTVSNADAQDWINRVYANGGTVSTSTAAAVNTLCDSLESASLRDRFYRLNLFCGTGLNAALVPLYRGPSLGGTQYGNATDTNNAFVGVGTDYAETGASGGLTGNGTSKYLNTGLTVSNIGTASSGHMSVYHGQSSGLNSNRYYMGANDASTINRFYFGTDAFSTANVFGSYGSAQNATQTLGSQGHGPAGHRILSRESDSLLTHYHNGSVLATNTTPITPAVSTAAFAVFAANRNGTVDRFHNSWIAAYSIGLGLNSTQAANYRTIMQTFQTALTRNV